MSLPEKPQIYAVTWRPHHGPIQSPIIQDWPTPQKVKDIQYFLGFANFYHHFIYRYSELQFAYMSYPQGYPFNFSGECLPPLKHLKRLSPQPGPYPLDPRHSNHSQDWCLGYALTAVFQLWPWWWLAPNCIPLPDIFCPRINYNVHDKELLTIFEAFKWQHYLEGSGLPIDVVTDHQNLQYFQWQKSSHVNKYIGLNTFPDSTL